MWVGGVGHDGGGADESAQRRRIPTRRHVYQANALRGAAQVVVPVPGVAPGCQPGGGFRAPAAKGQVAGCAAADGPTKQMCDNGYVRDSRKTT